MSLKTVRTDAQPRSTATVVAEEEPAPPVDFGTSCTGRRKRPVQAQGQTGGGSPARGSRERAGDGCPPDRTGAGPEPQTRDAPRGDGEFRLLTFARRDRLTTRPSRLPSADPAYSSAALADGRIPPRTARQDPMPKRPGDDTRTGRDHTGLLLAHLGIGCELLRAAVVRALRRGVQVDDRVRQALLERLDHADADVRMDAIEVLGPIARPEDAPRVRAALAAGSGPAFEVAAMDLLARLGDHAAVPLLRERVRGRPADRSAPTRRSGDSEGRRAVQTAAIRALARLEAVEAIGDLLAAREEDRTRALDEPVFAALAQMGVEGAAWLLAIARLEGNPVRSRALAALDRAVPPILRDILCAGMSGNPADRWSQ